MATTLTLGVTTQTTPKTGNPGSLPTLPAFTAFGHIIRGRIALAPPKVNWLERQQDIENALSTALWHIRKDGSPASIKAATLADLRMLNTPTKTLNLLWHVDRTHR